MNVDINKFNEIYPVFEKNVNTWVLYKYYRQMPLNNLKKLETFLNEVEGKKIYNCTSCNVGNMLKKLYEIKLNIDNDNKIKEQIKTDENNKELIQTHLFESGSDGVKNNNKKPKQQTIKKNNKKTKKKI
jgi:hypothetical protein